MRRVKVDRMRRYRQRTGGPRPGCHRHPEAKRSDCYRCVNIDRLAGFVEFPGGFVVDVRDTLVNGRISPPYTP